jgi:endonuclease-3 related protein
MLDDAAGLLREHYGLATDVWPLFQWSSVVRLVCSATRTARGAPGDWSWIDLGPLSSAQDAASARAPGIAEELKAHGQASRLAGSLHALALWWLDDAARARESPEAWERPIAELREELRIRSGVSLAIADRILLFVGGLPVFPIERGTLRIAVRHGWMEQSADYDEWQSFFTRQAADARDRLADIARWFRATGRDFCGSKPKCERCPLRALLPASGPIPLTEGDPDP